MKTSFSRSDYIAFSLVLLFLSSIGAVNIRTFQKSEHNEQARQEYKNIKIALFQALADPHASPRFFMHVSGPGRLKVPLSSVSIGSHTEVKVFHRKRYRRGRMSSTLSSIFVTNKNTKRSYQYFEFNGRVSEQVVEEGE